MVSNVLLPPSGSLLPWKMEETCSSKAFETSCNITRRQKPEHYNHKNIWKFVHSTTECNVPLPLRISVHSINAPPPSTTVPAILSHRLVSPVLKRLVLQDTRHTSQLPTKCLPVSGRSCYLSKTHCHKPPSSSRLCLRILFPK
jgi:hypothetical protein